MNPSRPTDFRQLLAFITPYRGTLLLALALMLSASMVALLSPWLAGQFTLALLENGRPLGLPMQLFLLCWLLVLAVQALLNFGNQYLISKTSIQMLAQLRNRLYDHLQSLPLGYYHERKRGEILTLMSNDAEAISSFVTDTLLQLLPLLLTFFGALLLIFLIDPMIALMIGILLPLFYLGMKFLGRHIAPVTGAMIEQYAQTFSIIEENIHLLPIIKSFTREERESRRFLESSNRLRDLSQRYQRIQAVLGPSVQFMAKAAILLLLMLSATKVRAGEMATADMVSLLLYSMLLTGPISGLANVYGTALYTRAAAGRLIDVFKQQPEPGDRGIITLQNVQGRIDFHNVRFSYPGREPVLDGFYLDIDPGETIAITGRNGAGKSTLAHLLLRFAPVQGGEIRIDDIPIQDITLNSLRANIGLVQQNVLLLNGSIRDNISFGVPEADEEAIRAAARHAHALAFIEQLPQGFDTLVGDQGIKLSGGQKQRLSLARALLKDPPILILDEATAMFDPAGERDFIQECRSLLHQRTVILITHRPASLALADRVIEITPRSGAFRKGRA